MAGRFINTKYTDTLNNLIAASNEKLNNPYYKFPDKKPTEVVYYNQNIEKSTLDEASGLYGAHLGKDSPFKFNKINKFILYGIERVSTEYDVGDNGLEAGDITGEIIILPNTITPRPGDYFYIPYIKEDVLFKINSVSPDTLDSGANIYKAEYKLENTMSRISIDSQVVKEYTFLIDNIGTDFKVLMQNNEYALATIIDNIINQLIIYFKDIFFDEKLQTFVFKYNNTTFYDPYLIEFLIKNKVLNNGDEYIYVSHATVTHKTFGMDYMKSFFYALENRDKDLSNIKNTAVADLIQDPNSLFFIRLNNYYKINYVDNTPMKTSLRIFDRDLFDRIENNEMYEKDSDKEFYNLWIAYMNGNDKYISEDYIKTLKKIDFCNNLDCFYALAITIFVIERCMNSLLS